MQNIMDPTILFAVLIFALGFLVRFMCMYLMLKPYKVSLLSALIGTTLMMASYVIISKLISALFNDYIISFTTQFLYRLTTIIPSAFLAGLIFFSVQALIEIGIEIWPAFLYFREIPKKVVLLAVSIAVLLGTLAQLGFILLLNYLNIITIATA